MSKNEKQLDCQQHLTLNSDYIASYYPSAETKTYNSQKVMISPLESETQSQNTQIRGNSITLNYNSLEDSKSE